MNTALLFDTGMNDLVFENRNKTYGAYQLRTCYDQRMSAGMLVSALLFVSIFLGISQYLNRKASSASYTPAAELNNIIVLCHFQEEIKPKANIASLPKAMAGNLKNAVQPTMVVNDSLAGEDTARLILLPPELPGTGPVDTSGTGGPGIGDGNGTGIPIEQPSNPGSEESPLHMYELDQNPIFPGGEAAMYKYLKDHLKYPLSARENRISGTVIVRFIVNPKGKTENVVVVKSVSNLFNAGSIEVIENMPPWTPGKKHGKPVPVIFTLQLSYQLL